MFNIQQLKSMLRGLANAQLQRFAQANKNDAIKLVAATNEMQRRKSMRSTQAAPAKPPVVDQVLASNAVKPAETGIARIPTPHMPSEYADGGIVAFGGGGAPKGDRAPSFDDALDVEGVADPRERAFLKALYAQESGSGANTATSNRGAVGAMQILPGTFAGVASPDMDINNLFDNMRAGIRYGRQGYQAAGGDPVLAGSYYYGGPGGLKALAAGDERFDPKNPKNPSTRTYGQQIAQRMFNLLPMGSAQAAQATQTSKQPPAPSDNTDDGTVYDPVTGVPLYQGLSREPERSAREVVVETLAPVGAGLVKLAKVITSAPKTRAELQAEEDARRTPFSTGDYRGKSGNPDEDIGPAVPAMPALTRKEENQVISAAKDARPDLDDEGMTRDDWLTLGFELLLGNSQYAGENLGKAGRAMLKGRQERGKIKMEREKAGLERLKMLQDIEYSKAHAKEALARAQVLEEANRPLAQYQKAVDAALLKLKATMAYQLATPAERAQMEQKERQDVATTYQGIAPTIAMSPTQSAALQRYGAP